MYRNEGDETCTEPGDQAGAAATRHALTLSTPTHQGAVSTTANHRYAFGGAKSRNMSGAGHSRCARRKTAHASAQEMNSKHQDSRPLAISFFAPVCLSARTICVCARLKYQIGGKPLM